MYLDVLSKYYMVKMGSEMLSMPVLVVGTNSYYSLVPKGKIVKQPMTTNPKLITP